MPFFFCRSRNIFQQSFPTLLNFFSIALTAGKIGGGSAVARIFGMTPRESIAVGVLMNTRGLVELIILNIGLDAGVLTEVGRRCDCWVLFRAKVQTL